MMMINLMTIQVIDFKFIITIHTLTSIIWCRIVINLIPSHLIPTEKGDNNCRKMYVHKLLPLLLPLMLLLH